MAHAMYPIVLPDGGAAAQPPTDRKRPAIPS